MVPMLSSRDVVSAHAQLSSAAVSRLSTAAQGIALVPLVTELFLLLNISFYRPLPPFHIPNPLNEPTST